MQTKTWKNKQIDIKRMKNRNLEHSSLLEMVESANDALERL